MTQEEIMSEIDIIIEESTTAVLASTRKDGSPNMRWMTPTLLKDRRRAVYAVTSPLFSKVEDIEKNAHVEWMFQTPVLNKIITVKGTASIIENASLKSEILEAIGRRLTAFWKLNEDSRNLIVLETVIEEAVFFLPMKGIKKKVRFG